MLFDTMSAIDFLTLAIGFPAILGAGYYLQTVIDNSDGNPRGILRDIKEDIIIIAEAVAKLVRPNYKDRSDMRTEKVRLSNVTQDEKIRLSNLSYEEREKIRVGNLSCYEKRMSEANAESLKEDYAEGVTKTQVSKKSPPIKNHAALHAM